MTASKIVAAAASGVGGAGLNVEDVFSTYLYDGSGTSNTKTIVNNIDLAGEGGFVWTKSRTNTYNHTVGDTESGTGLYLYTNTTVGHTDATDAYISSFNSDGYKIGSTSGGFSAGELNASGQDYASWTFRKAPKFFDVVTFSATGSGSLTLSHNLGSAPAFIIVKSTSHAQSWYCYHHSLNGGTDPEDYFLKLDSNVAEAGPASSYWGSTAPTSTQFTVGTDLNISGRSYVAYLFAHNNSDGEFGPDGDADIIKCGSWTADSGGAATIDLGWEPQWVLFKKTDSADDWYLADTMRGFGAFSPFVSLGPNTNAAETNAFNMQITPTGFKTAFGGANTYIYMAIRRGTKVPESATEVFEVFETTNTGTASTIGSMGPSDFILNKRTDAAATWRAIDRLRGGSMLRTDSTDTETSASNYLEWDKMGGVFVTTQGAPYITNDSQAHWMWKRAPGYFDVVAYTGDGVVGRTVSHNLGVAPEMMWVKNRDQTDNWVVYAGTDSGGTPKKMFLNLTNSWADAGDFNNTEPTAASFTLASDHTVNASGENYIAYLFASLDGISKVGSYTADGNAQNIDCGFTSGARFVLIKRTDTTGNWFVLDTARGIVSGNDPLLELNSTGAEDNQYDNLDPYSAGFTVAAYGGTSPYLNISGGTYIFYAIA